MLESVRVRLGMREYLRLAWRIQWLTFKASKAGQYSIGVWTLVAWVVGFLACRPEASKEFYSAATGVITTLLLALALTAAWFRLEPLPSPRAWLRKQGGEGQDIVKQLETLKNLEGKALGNSLYALAGQYYGAWLQAGSRWAFRIVYGVALLVALIAGEMFALLALMAVPPETAGNPRPVLAAIAAGLVGIGLSAILGARAGSAETFSTTRGPRDADGH